MKPQPEPNGKGPRPIPPIHPDTIAFEKHLRGFVSGQKLPYDEAARMVNVDLGTPRGDAMKGHLRTAARRLENGEGMVFDPYYDRDADERGLVRLDGTRTVDSSDRRTAQLSRAAKRIQRRLACADPTELSPEYRQRQGVLLLSLRGAQRFTETKGQQRLLRLVSSNSTERIPELEMAWKALNGN